MAVEDPVLRWRSQLQARSRVVSRQQAIVAKLDIGRAAGRGRWRSLPLVRHYVDGVERAHGLPPGRRQAERRHGSGARYLDNAYEQYGLSVEMDGLAAHPPEGRWQATHQDNQSLAQGPARR